MFMMFTFPYAPHRPDITIHIPLERWGRSYLPIEGIRDAALTIREHLSVLERLDFHDDVKVCESHPSPYIWVALIDKWVSWSYRQEREWVRKRIEEELADRALAELSDQWLREGQQ